MTIGNIGRGPPGQHQAHARVLVDLARRRSCSSAWSRDGPRRRRARKPAVALLPGRVHLHDARRVRRGRLGRQRASDERLFVDDWAGLGAAASRRRAGDDDLPAVARRHAADRRLLRQVLPVQGGDGGRRQLLLAGRRRRRSTASISIYYYLRIVTAMYFRDPMRPLAPTDGATMRAGLLLAAIAVVLLGIFPSTFVDWAGPVALKSGSASRASGVHGAPFAPAPRGACGPRSAKQAAVAEGRAAAFVPRVSRGWSWPGPLYRRLLHVSCGLEPLGPSHRSRPHDGAPRAARSAGGPARRRTRPGSKRRRSAGARIRSRLTAHARLSPSCRVVRAGRRGRRRVPGRVGVPEVRAHRGGRLQAGAGRHLVVDAEEVEEIPGELTFNQADVPGETSSSTAGPSTSIRTATAPSICAPRWSTSRWWPGGR